MNLRKAIMATGLAALGWPLAASATNGYFAHGYGVRSIGVAGVSIALPQDGLAAAKARQEVFDLRMKIYDLETANATLAEMRKDEGANRPEADASALLAAAAHADGQRRDLQVSVDALREEKEGLEQAIEALKAGHKDALAQCVLAGSQATPQPRAKKGKEK